MEIRAIAGKDQIDDEDIVFRAPARAASFNHIWNCRSQENEKGWRAVQ